MPNDISEDDLDLIARTMIGEDATPEGRAAVAHVILNRKGSGDFPNSVAGIVSQPNAFESWSADGQRLSSIPRSSPDYQSAYKIAQDVAAGNIPDQTNGSVNFLNPTLQASLGRKIPAWAQREPTAVIGKQAYFGGNKMASDDFLSDFEVAPPKSGSKPIKAAPAADDAADFEKDFEVAPQRSGPPIRVYIRKDDPIGANDAVRAAATGVPIVGGLFNKADAATNALLAPILNPLFSKDQQLQGDTYGERYTNALAQQQGMDTNFASQHPIANTALNIAGGVAGTAPLIMAAPAAFGISKAGLVPNALMSGVTGAGLNATDSAIRSGGDLDATKSGAIAGGVFGALAPVAGKLVGAGFNKLSDALAHTTPAARNVSNVLADIGMTPDQARNALSRMGPNATLADLDPALTTEAGGLASMGGKPTAVLKGAMAQRAAESDERMGMLVDAHLGPRPNAQEILNDIRERGSDLSYDPKIARAALDDTMGKSVDPYDVLQKTIKDRSEAAAPLYEKALSRPVQWDERLQQFIDDPVVKSGLAKGVRIQRLESLAENKPFRPSDYAIKDFAEDGSPIIGSTPNMRTLNVVKKGLDAMVEDAKDPLTGRLSEEGRAVDKVRSAFLSKLDDINPDYKAARQAWAGPSQTQDSFNRGLNIFQNRSGASGVNTTPQALSSWLKTASSGDQAAAKLGARAAYEQQMASGSDPAAKAASLANKEVNRTKLEALFGKSESDKLVRQLNFRYEDPVGKAFGRGLDIFKARQGVEGIADTPDAWRAELKNASPGELEAHRQGARHAIEQALTTARQGDVSAARSLFAKSTANRAKLEMLFPEAKQMLDGLDNELRFRATEQRVAQNSATAERTAIQKKYSPSSEPGINAALPIVGEAIGGGPGAVAALAGRAAYGAAKNALTTNALNRLTEGTARGLVAKGAEQREFLKQVERAGGTNALANNLSRKGEAMTNLLTRTLGPKAYNSLSSP